MSTDRELLQKAAKAAGLSLHEYGGAFYTHYVDHRDSCASWNPLTDDGDALRLAVKLNLWVNVYSSTQYTPQFTNVISREPFLDVYEEHGDDPYAATRRAIVRAAAAIGDQP